MTKKKNEKVEEIILEFTNGLTQCMKSVAISLGNINERLLDIDKRLLGMQCALRDNGDQLKKIVNNVEKPI